MHGPAEEAAGRRLDLRSGLLLALKLTLTIGLLYLVLGQLDWPNVIEASRQLTLPTMTAALVAAGVQVVLSAQRWSLIQALCSRSVGFAHSLRGMLIERFVNQAIPSIIGGDTMRVLELRGHGTSVRDAIYSVLIDRGMAVLGMLVLVGVGMLWSLSWLGGTGIDAAIYLILGISLAGIVAIVAFADMLPTEKIAQLLSLGSGVVLLKHVRASLVEPRYLVPALGYSILVQLTTVPVVMMAASDLGAPVSMSSAVMIVPLVTLFSLIPITIGGWGLREGAIITLLGLVGVPNSTAGVIGLLLSFSLAAVGLLCGLIWTLWGRRSAIQDGATK